MVIGKREQKNPEQKLCAQVSMLCRQKLLGYAESFEEDRMGQAIMNRLLKAAGHRVVEV